MSQIGTETSRQSAFSVHDLYNMAAKLISRHGAEAEGIAGYFAEEHRILGDADRASAWQAVQALVSDILSGEDFVPTLSVH